MYFFFCKENTEHKDISRLVTTKDDAKTTAIYLALDPIADSQQSIDAITVIEDPVALTMKTYRLEALNTQTRYMQMSVPTDTERCQSRQRWQNG